MKKLTGIPVSAGIAIGKAMLYRYDENPQIPCYNISEEKISCEWERFQQAVGRAIQELTELQNQDHAKMNKEQSDILQTHILMLEDFDFHDQIKEKLNKDLKNTEWIVFEVSQNLSEKLKKTGDQVLCERADDIADISRRLINCLLYTESKHSTLSQLNEEIILVANKLMPSDTLSMDKTKVKGIALDEGSKTSHTAILAGAFKIPAVFGLSNFSKEVKDGDLIALDGSTGLAVIKPDNEILNKLKIESEQECIKKKE